MWVCVNTSALETVCVEVYMGSILAYVLGRVFP